MDTIEEPITETKEDNFLVDGDMNLDDMFEMVEFDKGDYECSYSTVAGWCTEVLDDFPKEGQSFDFDNENMILHVNILKVQGVRVEQIRIVVEHIDEDEEEE